MRFQVRLWMPNAVVDISSKHFSKHCTLWFKLKLHYGVSSLKMALLCPNLKFSYSGKYLGRFLKWNTAPQLDLRSFALHKPFLILNLINQMNIIGSERMSLTRNWFGEMLQQGSIRLWSISPSEKVKKRKMQPKSKSRA